MNKGRVGIEVFHINHQLIRNSHLEVVERAIANKAQHSRSRSNRDVLDSSILALGCGIDTDVIEYNTKAGIVRCFKRQLISSTLLIAGEKNRFSLPIRNRRGVFHQRLPRSGSVHTIVNTQGIKETEACNLGVGENKLRIVSLREVHSRGDQFRYETFHLPRSTTKDSAIITTSGASWQTEVDICTTFYGPKSRTIDVLLGPSCRNHTSLKSFRLQTILNSRKRWQYCT